jgi:hypothetical protein
MERLPKHDLVREREGESEKARGTEGGKDREEEVGGYHHQSQLSTQMHTKHTNTRIITQIAPLQRYLLLLRLRLLHHHCLRRRRCVCLGTGRGRCQRYLPRLRAPNVFCCDALPSSFPRPRHFYPSARLSMPMCVSSKSACRRCEGTERVGEGWKERYRRSAF